MLWRLRWKLSGPVARREAMMKLIEGLPVKSGQQLTKALARAYALAKMGVIDDEKNSTRLMSIMEPDHQLAQEELLSVARRVIDTNLPAAALSILVASGLDVNQGAGPGLDDSLITSAAGKGRVEHVKVLLAAGVSAAHCFPLSPAVKSWHSGKKDAQKNARDILAALLDAKFDPNAIPANAMFTYEWEKKREQIDRLPLMDAALFQWHEGMDLLIAHGANARLENGAGFLHGFIKKISRNPTPWEDPAQRDKMKTTIQKLVDAGADLNGVDTDGSTPLSLAAEYGCLRVFSALWELGADPHAHASASDHPIGTILVSSLHFGHLASRGYLEELPASLFQEKNQSGENALDLLIHGRLHSSAEEWRPFLEAKLLRASAEEAPVKPLAATKPRQRL